MRRLITNLFVSTLLLSVGPRVDAQKKTPPPPKKEDQFLNGAKFGLEQLTGLIEGGAIPPRRLQEAVQKRGVNFVLDTEAEDRLKKAGVNDDLLILLREIAPKPAPKPPAPPKPARISFRCGPQECEVSVNGSEFVSTQGGHFEVPQIGPGRLVADFRKEGFTTAQRVFEVQAGAMIDESVTLAPDPLAMEQFGAGIWQSMVQSLGGDEGLRDAATLEGMGSVTLPVEGRNALWNVLLRNSPDKALFQLRSAKIFHEIAFEGTTYAVSKALKGDDALQLATELGAIRESLLPALLARLKSGKYRIMASAKMLRPSEEFALRAESPVETILIALDASYRPVKVKIDTATGIGSRLIVYSGYARHGTVDYPGEVQVKALSAQSAALLRLDSVTVKAALRDVDYSLRGKPLPGLK